MCHLRHLKRAIDARRDESGLFLLTGSQKFPLMQGVTESLAGRVAVLQLHSLSLKELERFSGKQAEGDQLIQWMLQGGYPEVHSRSLDAEQFYSDYVATYLERDVRQLLNVRSLRDFNRFLRLAASRTGQLLSLSSFSGDLGLSPNTIKSWLSVLEASNVIVLLEPYYRNLGKRIVKTPKLYFLDTGLACFLAGIRNVKALRDSTMLGAMFETLALGQMMRAYANAGRVADIYFYRDHYGNEIDFLIPEGEKLRLFECKWLEIAPGRINAFDEIAKLAGDANIASRSLITPVRRPRFLRDRGLRMQDCVDFSPLLAETAD